MNSKTFKSSATNRTLTVEVFPNGAFSVVFSDDRSRDLVLQGDDAPALALAILEAAGVEAKAHEAATVPYGTPAHIEMIASHLKVYAEAKSRNDAEAEAQAKLETEALELRNAYFDDVGSEREWNDLTTGAQSTWLAVARRARELNKEDNNA